MSVPASGIPDTVRLRVEIAYEFDAARRGSEEETVAYWRDILERTEGSRRGQKPTSVRVWAVVS
jgi:hypothetical protein